jgi:hypothetical protein
MVKEIQPNNLIQFPNRRSQNRIVRSSLDAVAAIGTITMIAGGGLFIKENLHPNHPLNVYDQLQISQGAEPYITDTSIENQTVKPSSESFGLIIAGATTLAVSLAAKAYKENSA